MKQIVLMSLLLTLLSLSGQASANPIISLHLDPAKNYGLSHNNVSRNIFLDINISGLTSLLGAFSMDVVFDPNLIFLPQSSTFDDNLGKVIDGEAIIGGTLLSPGLLNLFEVSLLEGSAATCNFCIGPPYLESYQVSDSFTLATLAFYVPYANFPSLPAITWFEIANNAQLQLSDDLGNSIPDPQLDPTQQPFTLTVVSEPPSFFLLGIGLIILCMKYKLRDLSHFIHKQELT